MQTSERTSNNFNFLRLLLATLVLLSHSQELVAGDETGEFLRRWSGILTTGSAAVSGFFIISGYLITASWLRQPSPIPYLLKRVGRIYPAFLVSGMLVGLVAAPLLFGWRDYYSIIHLPRFLESLLLLQYHAPQVRLHDAGYEFNEAVWTIHVEFWCYLTLMLLGLARIPRRRCITLALLIALTILILSGREASVFGHLYHPLVMPMPLAFARFLLFFLAGSCAYLFQDKLRYSLWPALAAFAACIVVLSPAWNATSLVWNRSSLVWNAPILAWCGGYALLTLAFAKIPVLERFERAADISYGTYLYGWPIQITLALRFPTMPWPVHFLLSCLGAYACGFASWHLVEKWFVSKRHRRLTGEVPTATADPT